MNLTILCHELEVTSKPTAVSSASNATAVSSWLGPDFCLTYCFILLHIHIDLRQSHLSSYLYNKFPSGRPVDKNLAPSNSFASTASGSILVHGE